MSVRLNVALPQLHSTQLIAQRNRNSIFISGREKARELINSPLLGSGGRARVRKRVFFTPFSRRLSAVPPPEPFARARSGSTPLAACNAAACATAVVFAVTLVMCAEPDDRRKRKILQNFCFKFALIENCDRLPCSPREQPYFSAAVHPVAVAPFMTAVPATEALTGDVRMEAELFRAFLFDVQAPGTAAAGPDFDDVAAAAAVVIGWPLVAAGPGAFDCIGVDVTMAAVTPPTVGVAGVLEDAAALLFAAVNRSLFQQITEAEEATTPTPSLASLLLLLLLL